MASSDVTGVEPDRKLVSIERILNIYPIDGAERIELAEINGWQCIVKKGEFQIGDLVIYFAIDSIVDVNDENTAFLKDRGSRIKTMKMRGVVSQGLIGSMKWLSDRNFDVTKYKEGDDVTKEMGVTKYVAEEELSQYTKVANDNYAPFPDSIIKTDEPRLQNDLSVLERICDREIVVTLKLDGCSCTVAILNGRFLVCGRNYEWKAPDKSNEHYFHIIEKYKIEEGMRRENYNNIAFQGEIIGPKINGNKMKQTAFSFNVFNVYNTELRQYYNHDEVVKMCEKLGIEAVPLIYSGKGRNLGNLSMKQMMELSERQEYGKGEPAEGIVVKTSDTFGPRISFKVISNKFLLHNDKKK